MFNWIVGCHVITSSPNLLLIGRVVNCVDRDQVVRGGIDKFSLWELGRNSKAASG